MFHLFSPIRYNFYSSLLVIINIIIICNIISVKGTNSYIQLNTIPVYIFQYCRCNVFPEKFPPTSSQFADYSLSTCSQCVIIYWKRTPYSESLKRHPYKGFYSICADGHSATVVHFYTFCWLNWIVSYYGNSLKMLRNSEDYYVSIKHIIILCQKYAYNDLSNCKMCILILDA